jgi:hypothetical protein
MLLPGSSGVLPLPRHFDALTPFRAARLSVLLQMSDKEMYQKVISGAMPGTAHFSWVGARAQLLLSQLSNTNMSTKRECLEYLGSHFRIVLNSPDR